MSGLSRWAAAACCLAMLAAGPVSAPAGAAQSDSVTLAVDVTWSAISGGMFFWGPPPAYGTWSATGAIADGGTASAWYAWYFYGWPPSALTLWGAKGGLRVIVSGSTWTIQSGTGAYANATGGGSATVTTTTYSWFGYVSGYRFVFGLQGTAALG